MIAVHFYAFMVLRFTIFIMKRVMNDFLLRHSHQDFVTRCQY